MTRGTRSGSDLLTVSFGMAVDSGADSASTRGVSVEALKECGDSLAKADAWLREGRNEGRDGVGWLSLPYKDIGDIQEAAGWLRGFNAVVQAGIGGSALGNLMLHGALLPVLERTARGKTGRSQILSCGQRRSTGQQDGLESYRA